MPTALTPKNQAVTISTDPARNNAAETNVKNNFPLTQEIKNVENTLLQSDIGSTEEIPSENKISSRAGYHKEMKTLYEEFKKEYQPFKNDLISLKKRPAHLKGEKLEEYFSLRTKKQNEEPLLEEVFSSLEGYMFSSSDRGGNYRPNRYEMQYLADFARKSDNYINYMQKEHGYKSPKQAPRLVSMVAALNRLSYNNVSFLIQEKLLEANVIKATPDKKNIAQQRWNFLKKIVLMKGKSMERNYLFERLANKLFGGKMNYVSQKGFAAWKELNKKDVLAAENFSPSSSSEDSKAFNAFFKRRKFIINEEHLFSFFKNSNFLDWMYSEYLPDRLCYYKNYQPSIDEIEDAFCDYIGIDGVTYLTPEELRLLEVKPQEEGFFDISGNVFSTEKMHIGDNESGWAAYVLSPENKLYIHSHIPGKFHHSSFLGGEPVEAAGTVKISPKGKLLIITPKSGHYKTTPAMFAKMLSSLHKNGVELKGVAAQPNIFSPDYYDAYELMKAGGIVSANMNKLQII